MPLPSFPTAAQTFIDALTDASMLDGGHRTNFIPTAQNVVDFGQYARDVGLALIDIAEDVAADAASAAAGSGTEMTAANIRALADLGHYLSMRRVIAANKRVVLTDTGPVAFDVSTGINFQLTMATANRALTISNIQEAKSGTLVIIQGGAGGFTISDWGASSVWYGDQPSWPATGKRTLCSFVCEADGKIYWTWGGNTA